MAANFNSGDSRHVSPVKGADKTLHVAFVVRQFAVGGLERCIARVANKLDRTRFKVSIICLNTNGTAAHWIEKEDIQVFELRHRSGNSARLIFKLAKTLRRAKVDVVHSHNWGTLVESSLASWLAGGIPHVHAERGTLLGPPTKSFFKRQLRKIAMKHTLPHCAKVMTNAQALAEVIRNTIGLSDLPVLVVPNGVDLPITESEMKQQRSRIRSSLGIDKDHFVVGSVGRMNPVKNFDLAIEGFANVEAMHPHMHLLFVGDGAELQRLKAKSIELTKNVHFVGNHSDPWPYLAAMDLYINTSTSEGMSQSILEAQAAGKSILASDVGDSKLVIDGRAECGEVFQNGNQKMFEQKLTLFVTDKDKQERCSRNSKKVSAELYGFQKMLASFESLYDDFRGNSKPCV